MSNYDDFSDYQPPKDSFASPARKQRGCLFYGCLISGILTGVLVLIGGVVAYMGYSWYSRLITQHTSDAPVALPQSPLAPDEEAALRQRYEDAQKVAASKSEKKATEIALTGDEINALIQRHADFAKVKDIIAVSIEGNKIKCQVSIPLEKFEIPLGKGRYFNGEGQLEVSKKDGRLLVYLDQIKVKGVLLPDEFQRGIRNENLAKNLNEDPNLAKKLESIESIEVKDGKLVIRIKASNSGAASDDGGPAKPAAPPAQDENQKSDGAADESKKSPEPEPEPDDAKKTPDAEKSEKSENSSQKKAA